jgi:exodeoxyribonuclease V gamma subunit
MKSQFEVYLSNKIEHLLQYFKEGVYVSSEHPLTKRLIIVSSPALKSWLMLQLAKDPSVGVAAGLEIRCLEEAIETLRNQFQTPSFETKKIPSLLEMSFSLELEIRKIGSQFKQMPRDEQSLWFPLFQYLQILPGESISKKSERRLVALTAKLALLFKQYGKYGYKMIAEWEHLDAKDWQIKLWQQIFHKNSPWTFLYTELNRPFDSPPQNLQIHLFSISHVPPLLHHYLERFSPFISLKYYLLSHCQYFWSDIRSDKETHRLSAYWKAKGVSEQQQDALEEFLRDRNPLLANFGRLGREMAQLIENSSAESFECYSLPQSIKEYPQLESITDCTTRLLSSSSHLTLLEAVQTDLLLLRNPGQDDNKLHFEQFDESIQVHCSCTKLREIQALHDLLISILTKHQADEKPIVPEDIIVMAPDIAEYESFIKMVFQSLESKIEIHIMDLLASSHYKTVQGFTHLISIASSRWDASTLLQLFEYKAFQKKQQLEQEDVEQYRLWIKAAGIRWGTDKQHRNELLERDHCLNGGTEQSSSNTWEDGFNRLLMGLVAELGDESYLNISTTQSDLLGKLLKILNSLRVDLKPLSDGSLLTLKEWVCRLQDLYTTYFYEDLNESTETLSALEEAFCTLNRASKFFINEKFSFISIQKQVEALLNQHKTNYRESRLNAVTFCSLLPMRTIPAKVIVLLGLQEGCYPRAESTIALNLLIGNPKADYFPSQTDFDRYLFLEALLSARHYFVMSYLGYSEKDFKEQMPSLLITEMLNYFDKSYDIQGDLPSKKCHFKHPFQAFSSCYFEENSQLKSYSPIRYKAATAYYQRDKAEPYNFIPTFQVHSKKYPSEDIYINLSDLRSYAKNPLKTYFNKKLGIYLSKEEDRVIKNEESLLPTRLEFDALKKASLTKSFAEVLCLANQKNLLPPRMFKDISIETLKEKIEELKSNLDSVNVNPEELFEIEFSEHYAAPKKTVKGFWQLPPLKINYKDGPTIKIVGKLNDVAPQGLLEHIRNERDVFKSWPSFLAFQCLVKEHALPLKPHLLFMKSGSSKPSLAGDPYQDFAEYLEYYFTGLECPSPLLPEWIPILVKEDHESIMKSLRNLHHQSSYNDYLEWYLNNSPLSNTVLEWKIVAEKLFGSTINEWFKYN